MSDPISTPLFMFNPIVVDSSSLAKLDYDNRQSVLQAEFRDGSIYQYAGVPIETYRELLQAESKGGYFNHRVRRSFPHVMLRAPISASVP